MVVYMGLASAAAVRDGLVKAGRDPATPAAVLARGTRPDSRAVVGRLDDLPKLAASAGEGPALLVDRRGGGALEAVARDPRIPECTGGRMTSPHEQKKRKVNGSVVVTANRLGDGAVVYRTVNDDWTTDLASAAVVAAPAAAVLLQRAEADGVRAVGPYIAPVELAADSRVLPGNLRERIRLAGPTFTLPGTL